MILIDARRTRQDLGPGNGRGAEAVRIANVEYGNHDAYIVPPSLGCAICNGPVTGARMTCSRACARALYNGHGDSVR